MSRSHIGRTLRNARFCSRMPRMDAVSDGSVALPDRADITVSQCHNAALSQTHTHTTNTRDRRQQNGAVESLVDVAWCSIEVRFHSTHQDSFFPRITQTKHKQHEVRFPRRCVGKFRVLALLFCKALCALPHARVGPCGRDGARALFTISRRCSPLTTAYHAVTAQFWAPRHPRAGLPQPTPPLLVYAPPQAWKLPAKSSVHAVVVSAAAVALCSEAA